MRSDVAVGDCGVRCRQQNDPCGIDEKGTKWPVAVGARRSRQIQRVQQVRSIGGLADRAAGRIHTDLVKIGTERRSRKRHTWSAPRT